MLNPQSGQCHYFHRFELVNSGAVLLSALYVGGDMEALATLLKNAA
jgi:hypothetical protein